MQDHDERPAEPCFRERLGDNFYVNVGPEHMPLGLADRRAHDQRLAERGERDES